jgi:N-acetylglucosamine kinase-like BadF-type ATPase
MSGIMLAVDLGQTGFRARIIDGGNASCNLFGPGYVSGTTIDDSLLRMVEEVSRQTGTSQFETVSVGMTGVFGRVPGITGAAGVLRREFGVARLIVADDAVTSFLGALGTCSGVVVAAGTGLVGMGHRESGQWARIDGAGPMLGDEGAGWWIGRQGLISALSASDGRAGGSHQLLSAAERAFGPIAELPSLIASSPSPIAAVAVFAREVADAARNGDTTARKIWRDAAAFIARAIEAAALRVRLEAPVEYVLVGGVARALDLLEPELSDLLDSDLGRVTRLPPRGDSLDGAEQLLSQPLPEGLGALAHETNL